MIITSDNAVFLVLPQYILCSSEAMANDLIHAWGTKDNIGNKEYYLPKYRKTESFALHDLATLPNLCATTLEQPQ